MHAVVVRVTIKDQEAAQEILRERIVPQVSGAPGFVTGHWTRRDDSGMAMIIFESDEAAQAVAGQIEALAVDPVTIEGVEVREVVAHA